MNLKVFMNYLSIKFFLIYSPFILTRSLSIEISTSYRHGHWPSYRLKTDIIWHSETWRCATWTKCSWKMTSGQITLEKTYLTNTFQWENFLIYFSVYFERVFRLLYCIYSYYVCECMSAYRLGPFTSYTLKIGVIRTRVTKKLTFDKNLQKSYRIWIINKKRNQYFMGKI